MSFLQRATLAASLAAAAEGHAHAQAGASVTSSSTTDGDPAVVAILEDGAPSCTGVVIAPRAVLSAAHCVRPGHRLSIAAGAVPGESPPVGVSEARVHPAFDRPTLANDVAVLISKRALDVEPATRAAAGELAIDLHDVPVRLVGYGFASLEDRAQIKREGWAVVSEASETQLRLAPSPSQPCLGDSGGPVFVALGDREVLAATVSWGDQRCASFAYARRLDTDDPFIDEALAAIEAPAEPEGCSASRTPGLAPVLLIALAAMRRPRRRPAPARATARPRAAGR
jgi:secreted trypsin-like serine protease